MAVSNSDPVDQQFVTFHSPQEYSDICQTARIVEQPASIFRFRYKSEGNKSGSLPGINNSSEIKTFPTIEILGHEGKAVVVASCVTKDCDENGKFHPHPHGLTSKYRSKNGVITVKVDLGKDQDNRVVFSDLGIQCVKKKEIQSSLKARSDVNVDPFNSKYVLLFLSKLILRFQPGTVIESH